MLPVVYLYRVVVGSDSCVCCGKLENVTRGLDCVLASGRWWWCRWRFIVSLGWLGNVCCGFNVSFDESSILLSFTTMTSSESCSLDSLISWKKSTFVLINHKKIIEWTDPRKKKRKNFLEFKRQHKICLINLDCCKYCCEGYPHMHTWSDHSSKWTLSINELDAWSFLPVGWLQRKKNLKVRHKTLEYNFCTHTKKTTN